MTEQDFKIEANAQGYRILYKGHSIGGAGILGQFKGRGRARRPFPTRAIEQAHDYREQAQKEIAELMAGRGQARFRQEITRIDLGHAVVKCACGLPMRPERWADHWRTCKSGSSVPVTKQDVENLLAQEARLRREDGSR